MNKFKFIAGTFEPLRPHWVMACSTCRNKYKLKERTMSVHMLSDPDAPGCMLCGNKEDGLSEVLAPHRQLRKLMQSVSDTGEELT